MRKKQYGRAFLLLISGSILLSLIFFLQSTHQIPQNSSTLWFYLILWLIDVYLWFKLSPSFSNYSKPLKLSLFILFWTPFGVIAGMLGLMTVYPFEYWSVSFRTWSIAAILLIYLSKSVPLILLLISDAIKLATFRIKRSEKRVVFNFVRNKKQISRSRFIRNAGILGGGIVFSGLLVSLLKWAYDFRVHRVRVALPKWPSQLNGFKIVQISDIHFGSWINTSHFEQAVNQINALNPDLIVFTGDLVNYESAEAIPFKPSMSKLKAMYGVYAILGNHDYGNYIRWKTQAERLADVDQLKKHMIDSGWNLLLNSHSIITTDKGAFCLAGVENWGYHRRFPRKGDLPKAINGVSNNLPIILLSHDPTHFERIVAPLFPQVGLTLSGHTHGAQLGVENRYFRWSPSKYIYKYWAGLYHIPESNQFLYVNRGLGSIGFPGRVGILPEITLLEIESSESV